MKVYFIVIALFCVIMGSTATKAVNLDMWNQYSTVFGEKIIHNVYNDADTLGNSLAFENQHHPSNTSLPSYTISCSNYSVGATISTEARNRLDLTFLKPIIVDKLGNVMCFIVKKETPARYTKHMHFSSQVPPTLKVESSLYKFIEKLMKNQTVSSDDSTLTAMIAVFEPDMGALSIPADIEEALYSLRGYNLDSFQTFYWSSSAYAGYVKMKSNTTTPSPYSNIGRTAWVSINQTLEGSVETNSTTALSVNDPCEFLKLTHKSGVDRITIDISATASIKSNIKGVCLAYITATLAQNPRVRLISLTSSPTILNYHSRSIQQSGNVGASSTVSPYSAAGLLGDGQIIGIADTGVDESSCYFSDTQNGYISRSTIDNPTFDLNHRKIVQYIVADGGDTSDEYGGHGTHTCGTALGGISGGDLWTSGMYDGVVPNAKLAFVDCGVTGGGLSIPDTAEELYGPSYMAGSRIHSNSWGSSFSGGSGYYANNDIDQYLYDHTDSVILFAAGNSGMIGYNTISMEAAAKNVIAVGSSESTLDSKDINYIAYYSSKGPTYDGRIKPDILAPGDSIMSVLSNGGSGSSCGTTQKTGTSMAAPGAAGIAGIIRQYFSDPQFWATMCNPIYAACKAMSASGVLVKAVLLHSGSSMTLYDGTSGAIPLGSTPDVLQGYGRVTLSNVLPLRNVYSFNLFVEDLTTIQENTQIAYAWTVYSSTKPMKVTITWYDPPNTDGTTNAALIHNLDLQVVSPSGYTFFGNQDNQNWVIPDSVNTNEQVNVDSPETGNWQIFVISNALPYSGHQQFSVVITSN